MGCFVILQSFSPRSFLSNINKDIMDTFMYRKIIYFMFKKVKKVKKKKKYWKEKQLIV